MKKKGLIISTVVMAVVLIASLTTATYAWFSTSSTTKISNFDVAVVSNSMVRVGVKTNGLHATKSLTADAFLTGAVTYVPGTAGQIGGTWKDGSKGLSSSLEPTNVKWDSQSSALGITKVSGSTDPAEYTALSSGQLSGTYYFNAANLSGSDSLTTPVAARANTNGSTGSGEYVYYFLGASPAKALKRNDLVIAIDATGSTGTTVGILSAIHVCYRYTLNATGTTDVKTTDWVDVDIMEKHQNDMITDVTNNMTDDQKATYLATYGSAAPTTGMYSWSLKNVLSKTINAIDQIELIIYFAGSDSDCIDSATGASGRLYVFFDAAE